MTASAKKYKLFSTTAVGELRPCAFFASPAGCRNGESCKFAHTSAPGAFSFSTLPPSGGGSNGNGSVVSSESSSASIASPKMTSDEKGPNLMSSTSAEARPTQVDVSGAVVKAAASTATDGAAATDKKKRKKRKKSKDPVAVNPFAVPKKKQKSEPLPPSNNGSGPGSSPAKCTASQAQQPKSEAPPASMNHAPFSSKKPNGSASHPFDYRSLNLPVSPFPMTPPDHAVPRTASAGSSTAAKPMEPSTSRDPATAHSPPPSASEAPSSLQISSEEGRKWLDLVAKTRRCPKFKSMFDLARYKSMDEEIGYSAKNFWVETKPYGPWSQDLPQVIALDCEMCETQDPVSGRRDPRSLCRISIVDAVSGELLLDSLVKPNWPVVDYRTFVNGITEEHLENVKFTLRHAQAFLLALCSQETVILGHALHNDLAAMRLEHYCLADSSCLYEADDNAEASVSLRDLAAAILKQTMPEVHDSVNDAKTALACLKHCLDRKGIVDKIKRSISDRPNYGSQLFLHRIPKNCEVDHITQMFLAHTSIQPEEVDVIAYSGENGKTLAHFRSKAHAQLAFESLESKVETDASGRLQKKVYLRTGGYIRVRKMAFEGPKRSSDDIATTKGDSSKSCA